MSAKIYTPGDLNAVRWDSGGIENRFRFERDFRFGRGVDVLDAAENAFLERQLRHTIPLLLTTELPEITARTVFPVYFANDPGAETFGYERTTRTMDAEVVANYANNPPTVEVSTKEFDGVVRGIWDATEVSIQDVRAAAKAGRDIDGLKQTTAREAILRKENTMAWYGDADFGVKGFFTEPLIPREDAGSTFRSNTGSVGAEANLQTLHEFADAIPSATNDIYKPDTLALASADYDYLAKQRLGTTGEGPMVLADFLQHNTHIKTVLRIRELTGADSDGNNCAVAFRRDLRTLRLMVFLDLEQWPTERISGVARTTYHMRTGGVVVTCPQAVRILEGTG